MTLFSFLLASLELDPSYVPPVGAFELVPLRCLSDGRPARRPVWSSSDPDIATVNVDGVVHTKKLHGVVVIRCEAEGKVVEMRLFARVIREPKWVEVTPTKVRFTRADESIEVAFDLVDQFGDKRRAQAESSRSPLITVEDGRIKPLRNGSERVDIKLAWSNLPVAIDVEVAVEAWKDYRFICYSSPGACDRAEPFRGLVLAARSGDELTFAINGRLAIGARVYVDLGSSVHTTATVMGERRQHFELEGGVEESLLAVAKLDSVPRKDPKQMMVMISATKPAGSRLQGTLGLRAAEPSAASLAHMRRLVRAKLSMAVDTPVAVSNRYAQVTVGERTIIEWSALWQSQKEPLAVTLARYLPDTHALIDLELYEQGCCFESYGQIDIGMAHTFTAAFDADGDAKPELVFATWGAEASGYSMKIFDGVRLSDAIGLSYGGL